MFTFVTFASLTLPFLSAAQLVPTGPGPQDVFKQGSPCSISWTADTSGKWKNTFIELMTGSNNPMTHLTTVANVDGTDPTNTSISIPCPAVTPNAPIYFYQFTAQGQNTTWTGRFTIADPNGASTPPPNANQPDGSPIPWGVGKLVNQGSPPPPTAPLGQLDGSNPGILAGAAPSTVTTPSNSSTAASTPSFTPSSSVASNSGISSALVPATTSALSLPSSTPSSAASSTASASHNSAITNTLPPAPALVAAAILGLVTLC